MRWWHVDRGWMESVELGWSFVGRWRIVGRSTGGHLHLELLQQALA